MKAALADVDIIQILCQRAVFLSYTSSSYVMFSPINDIVPREAPMFNLRNNPGTSNALGSSSPPIASCKKKLLQEETKKENAMTKDETSSKESKVALFIDDNSNLIVDKCFLFLRDASLFSDDEIYSVLTKK